MKGKKYIAVVLALVLVLLTVSTVSAKCERTYFTSVENCDDDIKIGRTIMDRHGNTILKHFTQTCHDVGSIPQATGTLKLDLTLTITPDGIMSFEGKTTRFTTDEGGVWIMNCHYSDLTGKIDCVSKGEGKYRGMRMISSGTLPTPEGYWTGYIEGHHK